MRPWVLCRVGSRAYRPAYMASSSSGVGKACRLRIRGPPVPAPPAPDSPTEPPQPPQFGVAACGSEARRCLHRRLPTPPPNHRSHHSSASPLAVQPRSRQRSPTGWPDLDPSNSGNYRANAAEFSRGRGNDRRPVGRTSTRPIPGTIERTPPSSAATGQAASPPRASSGLTGGSGVIPRRRHDRT